jgi:transposase
MCLKPSSLPPIPEETARIARAAYRKGSVIMRIRDAIGAIYDDASFAELFPRRGQPAEAPWRLALVVVFQFLEHLTDRQAADAIRGRLDWKYALSLEVTDPGIDASVLCEFRARLVEADAVHLLLDLLLQGCREQGLLKGGGKQRTDSTHVLAAVRGLSHLEKVGETMRAALNAVAEAAPEWLVPHIQPEWFDRYSHRVENYRLPKGQAERRRLAEQIGQDGLELLAAVQGSSVPEAVVNLPALAWLRVVWQQHYEVKDGQARWREHPAVPEGECIGSPYDAQARVASKRDTSWLGYKVQVSETCDAEEVHLIVQVQTTVASVTDVECTQAIQQDLVQRELAPSQQLVDTGYVSGRTLVQSRACGIELVGPVLPDTSWQGRAAEGFAVADFAIDWQGQQATCPQGQVSTGWRMRQEANGEEHITVTFARTVCQACPCQEHCTHSQEKGRLLNLHAQPVQEAIQQRRQEQTTPEFQQRYAARAGIEGTLSQGVRAMGLRRSRYLGQDKTHLQHVATAAAINLVRVDAWLTRPASRPRAPSRFAQLREEKLA